MLIVPYKYKGTCYKRVPRNITNQIIYTLEVRYHNIRKHFYIDSRTTQQKL